MPRAVASLAVDKMSVEALFKRGYSLVQMARWDAGYGISEREQILNQLTAVLNEIQLRGYQMSIDAPQATASS